MEAARNTHLVNTNNTTNAPGLVDDVVYISDEKVEDITSDTVMKDEISMDKIINN